MFFQRLSVEEGQMTSGEVSFTNRHHTLSHPKPSLLMFVSQTDSQRDWLVEDQSHRPLSYVWLIAFMGSW